ncbi:TIGR04083 family peptide-modifying radical SAM enzyme [Methanoregula sp.]|uniref:TIGR04083 family peptide-modifying radical SAM enzyme n=1 Tax=Methanoregula sp. TaxID=2052170 RepID=UPI003C713DA1
MKNPFHIMLIPTLGCPSKCKYCWSSEEGSLIMNIDIIKDVVTWLKNFRSDRVTFTFHGGEPLLAGADFYRQALPLLSGELKELTPEFAMQTNLWRMTPEIAGVLAEYHVPIGSSIDGPEDITDSQRGNGYFEKTMRGYEIAKTHGLMVRFICTFTNKSVKRKEEIFNFFKTKGFVLKLHPALPSLRSENPKEWALEPAEYGELLVYLLDKSLENLGTMEVMNINDLCRCVFTRRGSVCTFVNCMGNTFAIGPDGSIYPCYRFVGMPEWVMGHVRDQPTMEQLMHSEPGRRMMEFSEYVDKACKDCAHIKYCRGGCPYNAIAPSGGSLDGVDPHCVAYKRIFDELNERLNREMFEEPMPGIGSGTPVSRTPAKPGVMVLMREIVSR